MVKRHPPTTELAQQRIIASMAHTSGLDVAASPQLCSQHTPFPVRLLFNTDGPTIAYPQKIFPSSQICTPGQGRISGSLLLHHFSSYSSWAWPRHTGQPTMRDFVNSASSRLKGFVTKSYPDCMLPTIESTYSHTPCTLLPPLK